MNLLDLAVGRGTALVIALALGSLILLRPEAPPQRGRVVVTDTETTILDVVEFAPGTATLRASSRPTLDAVADTLRGNPSIELVEVQSHTRDANLALSQHRADAVVAYLVSAGVEPNRVVAQGYGDTQPIDRAAPGNNERIAFLILKRASDVAER
ncbi:MAG TPA: OmpA family protein [Kofleriaceae bacterium]|nr:OmpA family protein [Kofleriaceae bacterium]